MLAARPGCACAEAGNLLGALVASGLLKLTRVVPALRDALNAGATQAVWAMLASALPRALAAEAPAHRLGDLLVLGFDAVEAGGGRGRWRGWRSWRSSRPEPAGAGC